MSDLEDVLSEPELDDSDKEDDDKITKPVTTRNVIPSKIKSELEDSSDEEEILDSDLDIDDLDLDNDDEINIDSIPPDSGEDMQKSLVSGELSPINSDVESDEEEHLYKFDKQDNIDYITKYHPECFTANSDEINALSQIIRENGTIIDKNHITNPILTKYEKTKILGLRTKQLNSGCQPYIEVPSNIIDNYLVAQMELKQKKIPIIIRRPISAKHSEYWKLEDLEQIY